ncbi:MAG TPA: M56 family metallopeptidase [Longimicrobium sp.]|nr:M56 family metallopeptidase [Longimicrobium sp.]
MLSLLVRASLEGAVLASGVWLVCRALPRMSPGVRALLWWCVAAKFVVALVWHTPIGVPVLPRVAAEAPDAEAGVTAAPPLSPPKAAGASRPASLPPPGSGVPQIPWTALVVGAWGLGLGISLLRTVHSWRRTRAVVSRSRPAGEELRAMVRELSSRMARGRTVDVRVSAEIESPLISGVGRPVILVPAGGFDALSPDQQRMALCHELAHLARGDLWLGCVPAAAERCFFFHPLARLAAREYAFWREAACDEAVLTALGASPQSYGRMLLALGVSRRTETFSAAGAAWSFQNLKRRITMLDRVSSPSLRGRALAAGAVAVAILAVAPVKVVARSAAPSRPQTTDAVRTPVPTPRGVAPAAAASAVMTAAAPATPTASIPEPAAPEVAGTGEQRAQEELPFVLFRGENSTMSGERGDMERARRHRRAGERLLWFRYGGREYVVRDPGVLRQAEALWEPVSRIGEEQGRIGAQQGAIGHAQGQIGVRQGEIGREQGRIGARQGVIGARFGVLAAREAAGVSASERRQIEQEREELEAEMRRLGAEMEALGQRMREVSEPLRDRGDEMTALGREMAVLGRQMEAAVERANAGMRTLVREAIRSGTAVAVG